MPGVSQSSLKLPPVLLQFFECPRSGGVALLQDRGASAEQRRTQCNIIEKNILSIWRSYYFPFMELSNQQHRNHLVRCHVLCWQTALKLNGRSISTPPRSSIKPCDKDGAIVPDGRRLSVRSPWQMQSRLWSSALGPAPPPETERLINTDGGRLALAPPQLSGWISPVSSTIKSVCVWRLTNGNLLRDDKGTC